jgi:hypothetical protein
MGGIQMDQQQKPENPQGVSRESLARRNLLKALAVTAGALAGSTLNLPKDWSRPLLQTGVLPAHAQTSPVYIDRAGTISANHTHSVTLTAAQQQAGQAVILTLLAGLAAHTHQISLSVAQVAAIAAGTQTTVVSTFDVSPLIGIHAHNVTFN